MVVPGGMFPLPKPGAQLLIASRVPVFGSEITGVGVMSRFRVIEMADTFLKRRWSIEEVSPGEKPVPYPFLGTRKEAESVASQLNLFGRSELHNGLDSRKARASRTVHMTPR